MTFALLVTGVLLIIAAMVVRVLIFNTMQDDPAAAKAMEGSLPIQIDLLSWELWRKRTLVARHHHWKADLYFGLHVAAAVAIIAGLLIQEFA